MIDVKNNVCIRECLIDGIPDLTTVVSCHQDWDFDPEQLAAVTDTLK
jgi:hypothetical protein